MTYNLKINWHPKNKISYNKIAILKAKIRSPSKSMKKKNLFLCSIIEINAWGNLLKIYKNRKEDPNLKILSKYKKGIYF